MKSQIAALLNQEMNRKEFFRYAGVSLLMLAGGGAVMQAISSVTGQNKLTGVTSKQQNTSYGIGYGSSPYGGGR